MANYTYLYTLLTNRTRKLSDTNPMKQAVRALGALNAEILSLTAVNEENRPQPLDKEKLTRLMQLYTDLQTRLKAAHKSGAKDFASQYLDEVMLLTNRDLEALRHVDPENPGDYITATSGSEHYTVDIAGKELDQIGGNASSRFPMSVPDGKGGFIDGYFTADSRNLPTANAVELVRTVISATQNNDLKRELEHMINGKDFDEILRTLFPQKLKYEDRETETSFYKPTADPAMASQTWMYVFNQGRENPVELNLSVEDAKRLFHMAQGIYGIGFNRVLMQNYSMIPEGGVIGQRNAAMTAMADFLGVPKLVARSNQMTVVTGHTPDGRPILKNGTFMEKAEGCDYEDFEYRRPPEILRANTHVDSLLKDVADLQMLDFICGNIDRHGENFFVKTEVTKDGTLRYTGVVGIDNDQSFGLLDPDMDDQNVRMFAPGRIGYMSRGMADKVNSMTRADLDTLLAGFGLGAQSIEAAWHRVQTVKKAIKTRRVKVVEDNAWVENHITLSKLHKKNSLGKEEAVSGGFAGILDNSCRRVVTTLDTIERLSQSFQNREKKKYREQNHIERGMPTPPEVKEELKKKGRRVAIEQEKVLSRLGSDKEFKAEYDEKARAAIIKEAKEQGIDPSTDGFKANKLSDLALENTGRIICLKDKEEEVLKEIAKEEIAKEKPAQEKPAQKAPAQERPKHHYDRVRAASGLAVRVSPLVERLHDLRESLRATTLEHGMSTEYRLMTEKLEQLQQKTEDLLNTEGRQNPDPGAREAQLLAARAEFRRALNESIEKTCYYISKKPATPIHEYGKERLDLAKQLRNAAMNARQVLDEELAVVNFGRLVNPDRTIVLREPQPQLQNAPEVNQPQLQNAPEVNQHQLQNGPMPG